MARDKQSSQQQIDAKLQQLDQRIDTLKRRYERYFLGIEQRPPNAMRKQVVREVFEMEQLFIRNTAQKFRLRALVQRFNTHKTRWNRIMRQIENGTYHRDRKRAERRKKQRRGAEERQQEDQAFELDPEADFIEDIQDVDLDQIFDAPQAEKETSPQPNQPNQSAAAAQKSEAEKERIKQQRLAEIQRQLGLDAGSGGNASPAPAKQPSAPAKQPQQPAAASSDLSPREQKLAAMRQKLARKKGKTASKPRPEPTSSPTKSSPQPTQQKKSTPPSARERKLQKLRNKISREKTHKKTRNVQRSTSSKKTNSGSQRRVVRRSRGDQSSDASARKVYENLLEAKRRCNEPTDNLTYESVKRSMDSQRKSLQKKRGARNVDFDVVIKDGQAFLKPDPKD